MNLSEEVSLPPEKIEPIPREVERIGFAFSAESDSSSAESTAPGRTESEHQTKQIEVEVDFFREPTLLSRLILQQKYESAVKRLRETPQEARIWLCSKRGRGQKTNATIMPKTEYSIRQLPIHIACTDLPRTPDVQMRATLNELIYNLIVSYPESCREVDHHNRLPLHEATWYGASPETISMFLMAYPESVESRDEKGHSVAELNRYGYSKCKKKVQEVLELGDVAFWRRKAALEKPILHRKQVMQDIRSAASLAKDGSDEQATPEQISQMESEQLENRAIELEQILSEVNESNFQLSKSIEALVKSNIKLLDKSRKSYLKKEVSKLQKENKKFKKKIKKMKVLLLGAAWKEVQEARRARSRGEEQGPFTLTNFLLQEENKRLLKINEKLQMEYDELNASYRAQRAKLHRLESIVEILVEEESKKSLGLQSPSREGDTSQFSVSDVSASSSENTPESRDWPQARRRPRERRVDVEWSPPSRPSLTDLSDSLSVIFHVAAHTEAREYRTQHRPRTSSTPDEPGEGEASELHDLEIPALLPSEESEFEPVARVGLDRSGLTLESGALGTEGSI